MVAHVWYETYIIYYNIVLLIWSSDREVKPASALGKCIFTQNSKKIPPKINLYQKK